MCWTSSDLIIVAASSPANVASVRRRRVPKGQQTVKIEPLYLGNHAPVSEPVRQRRKTRDIEQRHDGGVQEGQVAEAAAQLIIAHRQLGIDVLFLGAPRQRGT